MVGLGFLSLERSGTVLIMLIIGGVGRLYGAFIGVPLYMIAQDRFSQIEPVYWYFWIGLLMVLVVVFARGGVLGLVERSGPMSDGEPRRRRSKLAGCARALARWRSPMPSISGWSAARATR